MEQKIKIVIPSHKRADRVVSKGIVTDPILCVAKSQVAEYKAYNQDVEILAHPDSIVGLPRKRQWLYEKFSDLWMIDDDVTAIKRMYVEDGYDMTPAEARIVLQNVYDLAVRLGVYLFGISKNPVPVQYNAHVMAPIALTGFISGAVHGLRGYGRSKIHYTPELLNNDFWISLLNAYTNRRCLIDYRFDFAQKGTFAAQGGNAEYRTATAQEHDYRELKRYFGDSVQAKQDRKLAKAKVKFALTGRIKI